MVNLSNILKVFSNFYYLLSMGLILSLLGPSFCLILRYEIFSKCVDKVNKSISQRLCKVDLNAIEKHKARTCELEQREKKELLKNLTELIKSLENVEESSIKKFKFLNNPLNKSIVLYTELNKTKKSNM